MFFSANAEMSVYNQGGVIFLGLITGGGMPLTIREHAYMLGEAAMTIWFTKFGIPMDRFDEGMKLVREQAAEVVGSIPAHDLAPATIDPIERGMKYAEKPNDWFSGGDRDFDAIVSTTAAVVMAAAKASQEFVPIEERLMKLINSIGTDRGPQRE